MGEEKNRKCECQVCHRLYDRGEGVCECGADLATFGKWIEVDGPGPEPEPPRKIWKVVGLIALILLVAAGGVFAYIRMGPEKANEEAEERQEAQADIPEESLIEETEPETTETPSETPEAADDLEENATTLQVTNANMDMFIHVFVYPDGGYGGGTDILGWEKVLACTEEGSASTWATHLPQEAHSYWVDVVTGGGTVYRFTGVPGTLENCNLFFNLQQEEPELRVITSEGDVSIKGTEETYQDVYGYMDARLICCVNAVTYDFDEVYVYEHGADSSGENQALHLTDGLWSSYEVLKINVESSKTYDIRLVDTEGDVWFYENVDLSGVYNFYNELDDEGYPRLLLSRGKDDAEFVSGQFVEGE